jgi:hypothetical protein
MKKIIHLKIVISLLLFFFTFISIGQISLSQQEIIERYGTDYHEGIYEGNYIDFRLEEKKRFVLYAVNLFFVEVEYDEEENRIKNKRSFVSGEILDKYIFLD